MIVVACGKLEVLAKGGITYGFVRAPKGVCRNEGTRLRAIET